MTQNIPPGNDVDRRAGEFESDTSTLEEQRGGYRDGPYGARIAGEPDLDARSPVLRDEDVKRLNKKALIFLAGIVVLLVAGIFYSLSRIGGEEEQPKAKTEVPAIPEAPSVIRQGPAPTDPIAVQPDPVPPVPVVPDVPLPPAQPSPAPVQPKGPSLVERRISDTAGVGQAGPQGAGSMLSNDPVLQAALANISAQNNQGGTATAKVDVPTSAQFIRNPDVLMVRGTYIRCVLETRIITDIPGFTSCIVTEPVYSINGRSLLLPRGSKVLGRYDYEPKGPRVAVVWDRITTPNGIDVSMESPGVDNLGGAGHEAKYTAHWGSRIASALLISLISDAFKYAAAENGPKTTTVGAGGQVVQTPYESITAQSIQRLANQALDNRRPPTAIINQGTVVNVYVAKDVDFSGVVSRF